MKTFYVSPDGRDNARGSLSDPFATPGGAACAVRKWKQKHPGLPCRVILRDGVYSMDSTWELTAADSGTPNAPVAWCAAPGETPVLSGGLRLPADAFEAADQAFTDALREKPQNPVLRLDLKKIGAKYWETMQTDDGARYAELYVGSTRFDLPNYPKNAFLKFEDCVSETTFREKDPVVLSWENWEGIRAFGYMEADYFSVDTPVSMAGDVVDLSHAYCDGRQYRYYNVPYELSVPTDYYIDRRNGYLYVCPDETFFKTTRLLSQLGEPLLSGKGVSDMIFCGIAFEGVRATAVDLQGDRITFEDCSFSKIGGNAMNLVGMDNRILYCEACAIGGCGFQIGGGDCENLKGANTLVDSCHIHHFALNGHTYQAGVSISGGMGHTVSHNHIHHTIHNAINGYCPDLLVEYNRIHDVCREAHDAGAIYTGRWHARNTVYRYNLIYDNVNINQLGVPFGIYNDDSGSGKAIYGNILWNVAGYGVKQGGGNDNQIFNNIFIDTLVSVDDDDRTYYGNFQAECARFNGFFFHEQIAFPSNGTPAWNARYAAATLMRYTGVEDRSDRWVSHAPGMTVIRDNLSVHSGPVQVGDEMRRFAVQRDNVRYDSPEQAGIELDEQNHTFRILPDSPVWRDIPFWHDIPQGEIGPRPRSRS